MRLENHPILEFKRGKEIHYRFRGQDLVGYEGDTVASALHDAGVRVLSESAAKHRPRGLYCAIGNCSSCLMTVDGKPNVRVCVEPLKEGMEIEPQIGYQPYDITKVGKYKKSDKAGIVETDIVVVGGGPAGMCAALEAASHGLKVILAERNVKTGGQLVKQTHKFFGSEKQKAGTRGIDIAVELQQKLAEDPNITVWTDTTVLGYYPGNLIMAEHEKVVMGIQAKSVIISTGAFEKSLVFPNNDLPGIYGAGAVQTLMNQEGIKPGSHVLMVGAGNIGLIVSYQLLQAGVDVVAVVEAAPHFGGYEVHAQKLRRAGVPILTSHTVKYAFGKEQLEGAVICELDEKFRQIPGTEQEVKVDVMCIAVGLSPLIEMFSQAGCRLKFVPELGGHVPVIDEFQRTTVEGVYAAGDSGGIEEASSAMLTGRLAGLQAAQDMGACDNYDALHADYAEQLGLLRAGPGAAKIRNGLQKMREEV